MIAFHDPELSNHLNEIGFIPDVSHKGVLAPGVFTTLGEIASSPTLRVYVQVGI